MSERPDTEQGWREKLSPEEYKILREAGTEEAYSGEYHDCKKDGIYRCTGCGQPLFDSEHKFDSGTGWPSFWKPVSDDSIDTQFDGRLGMRRTEVICSGCQGHLGHVFEDGPEPSGLRYCINSIALVLDER